MASLLVAALISRTTSKVVRGDPVEPSRGEPWPKVLLDNALVLDLCRISEVEHRSREPAFRCFAESQPRAWCHAFATSSPGGKLIPKATSRQDPAMDGPPALETTLIPETDFQYAGRASVNPALYPHPAWGCL